MTKAPKLLVVGGGPVGVVSAVAATQAGFDVELIEAATEIDTRPRASTTHPSTLEMIDRIGLLDRFIAEGLVAREFQFWDRETGTLGRDLRSRTSAQRHALSFRRSDRTAQTRAYGPRQAA